jgi:hypothetical protein
VLVAAAFDQNMQHDPGLAHGVPQPVLRTGDLEHDLVQMPFVANSQQAATDLIGELLAEFARPPPAPFRGNDDAAGR